MVVFMKKIIVTFLLFLCLTSQAIAQEFIIVKGVSYGGSSILATFVLFNIIQGLYILKRNEEDEDEEE